MDFNYSLIPVSYLNGQSKWNCFERFFWLNDNSCGNLRLNAKGGDIPINIKATDLPILPRLDAKIPEWSLDKLGGRTCPLCRKDNQASLLRPDRLPVAYCADCGLWYVSGLPPIEQIQKLYQGYWTSFRPKNLSASYASALLSDATSWKCDISMNRLLALSGGFRGKRLLEIGCGCGEFLVGAQHRGATVFGNDISREACTFLREQLHIPVYEGPLSDSTFMHEYGQMDMVVLRDLIEHPVEPLSVFEFSLKVLRPNGLLLIYTPNGGGASDNPSKATEWIGFRKDLEHLQYFSPRTIVLMAGKYQCDIEHLETFEYPWVQGIDRLPIAPTPAPTPIADRSLNHYIRSQLKKSDFAQRLVRALRTLREEPKEVVPPENIPDPRCGTYSLLAILRRRQPIRQNQSW